MPSMTVPKRHRSHSVHQILVYDRLIREASCNTIILCGNSRAAHWPLARANVRAWDSAGVLPIFWVPYPGVNLTTPLMFGHLIVDSSWSNADQSHVDWFEKEVMSHVANDCLVTHLV